MVNSPATGKTIVHAPALTAAVHDGPPSLDTVTFPVGEPPCASTRNPTVTGSPASEGSGASETISVLVSRNASVIGADSTAVKPAAVNRMV